MSAQKPGLHPRNRHHSRYDLATLCQVNPELRQFLTLTPAGEQSVDFANPLAVKALNKALLAHFYAVAKLGYPRRFSLPASTGPGGLYSSPCRFTGRSKRNNSS